MDFEYSEEHQLVLETARDFARNELAPGVAERDENAVFPAEYVKAAAELGFMGVAVPEEWGGSGLDSVSYVLMLKEIARIDPSMCVIISAHKSLFVDGVHKFGTDEQKERFLRPFALGEKLGAFATTEPGCGSDVAAMSCRADRDGDDYIINGEKCFITNGKNSDAVLMFAATDKSKKHRGFSAFLVEKGTPGFTVSKEEHKLGIRSSDTASLVFQDCRVPAANRLGAEGQGFFIAMTVLVGGRGSVAAQGWGIAEEALELAVKYAKQRQTFGVNISNHQSIQNMIADMKIDVMNCENLTLRAAVRKDAGKSFITEASAAKLYCSEAACRCADLALQVHGGYGYTKDYAPERLYRDARIVRVYEGTSEIQRMIIAREVIKSL